MGGERGHRTRQVIEELKKRREEKSAGWDQSWGVDALAVFIPAQSRAGIGESRRRLGRRGRTEAKEEEAQGSEGKGKGKGGVGSASGSGTQTDRQPAAFFFFFFLFKVLQRITGARPARMACSDCCLPGLFDPHTHTGGHRLSLVHISCRFLIARPGTERATTRQLVNLSSRRQEQASPQPATRKKRQGQRQ